MLIQIRGATHCWCVKTWQVVPDCGNHCCSPVPFLFTSPSITNTHCFPRIYLTLSTNQLSFFLTTTQTLVTPHQLWQTPVPFFWPKGHGFNNSHMFIPPQHNSPTETPRGWGPSTAYSAHCPSPLQLNCLYRRLKSAWAVWHFKM